MTTAIFRPRTEPARTIYDVFQAIAADRSDVTPDKWEHRERMAVWGAARDYAEQHGLRVPTIAQVELAERSAMGHCDYGAKWAYGVAEAMRKPEAGP